MSGAVCQVDVQVNLETVLPAYFRPFVMRIKASPLSCRLASGAFWSLAGAVITRSLGLLSSIILARILGKEVFGEYGMIQNTVGAFGIFAGVGLGMTATRYVATYCKTDQQRAGRIIVLSSFVSWIVGGISAIILYVFAPLIATKVINAPHLVSQLRIGTLLLMLGGINGAQAGALTGLESFRCIAKINLIAGFLNFPFLLIGVYLGGLTGLIWGASLCLGANCLLNFWMLRRETHKMNVQLTFKGCFADWDILWKFSIPAILGACFITPVQWWCLSILANSPNGYSGLGEFSVAMQWRTMVMYIPGVLAGVATPTLSSLYGQKDVVNYNKALKAHLFLTAIIAAVTAFFIIVFAGYIATCYGESFLSAKASIQLLAISGFLIAINAVVGNAISSLGRMWTGLLFCFLVGSFLIISTYLFVPIFGVAGLALANVVAYAAHTAWQGIYLHRVLRRIA